MKGHKSVFRIIDGWQWSRSGMTLKWGRTKARPGAPQCRPEKCLWEYAEGSCKSAQASVGKTFKFTVE